MPPPGRSEATAGQRPEQPALVLLQPMSTEAPPARVSLTLVCVWREDQNKQKYLGHCQVEVLGVT